MYTYKIIYMEKSERVERDQEAINILVAIGDFLSETGEDVESIISITS